MNHTRLNIGLLTICLLAGAPLSAQIQALEEASVQVPATTSAIWQVIDQRTATLQKLIQAGTLNEVHHHAFAIRDLTAALLTHENNLTPEQRKELEAQVRFVATLAQRLDVNGDSNDRAGAASNFSKLTHVLETMRGVTTPASK